MSAKEDVLEGSVGLQKDKEAQKDVRKEKQDRERTVPPQVLNAWIRRWRSSSETRCAGAMQTSAEAHEMRVSGEKGRKTKKDEQVLTRSTLPLGGSLQCMARESQRIRSPG